MYKYHSTTCAFSIAAETRNTIMEFFKTLKIASGIFLFFMAVTTLIEGIPSQCQVYIHGTFAHVTCTFNVDISELPNDFQVDHIRSNGTNNNQVWFAVHSGDTSNSLRTVNTKEMMRYRNVLAIVYNRRNLCLNTIFMSQKSQGNLEYQHRPGYELFGTVGKTVTVKILELSREHAGKYMCAVIPSDPNEVELCDLPSEAIEISKKASTRSTDGPTSTLLGPTVPPTGPVNEELPYLLIGLLAGGSIAVFAIIAVILYILYRRRKAYNESLVEDMTSQTTLMSGETAQDKAPV